MMADLAPTVKIEGKATICGSCVDIAGAGGWP